MNWRRQRLQRDGRPDGGTGPGITASYWKNAETIRAWKRNTQHLFVQQQGKIRWHGSYRVRIGRVELGASVYFNGLRHRRVTLT